MNIFSIKCYFRANLKIGVTKNRIFWDISQVKSKSEIHPPGNFLLVLFNEQEKYPFPGRIIEMTTNPDALSVMTHPQVLCRSSHLSAGFWPPNFTHSGCTSLVWPRWEHLPGLYTSTFTRTEVRPEL